MRQIGLQLLLLLFSSIYLYSIPPIDIAENYYFVSPTFENESDLLKRANELYIQGKYEQAIDAYTNLVETNQTPSAQLFKKLALSHAAQLQAEKSTQYIEESLLTTFNANILMDSGFDSIRNTPSFVALEEKYTPNFTVWSFMYLYVALIGFYVAIILHFKKKIDPVAKTLISGFIFIHSFFILHICLNITNYQYEFPHSYLMSTAFSFSYGPLLYFYFKRITQQYTLKKKDLLHLLPTVALLVYLLPIYILSGDGKLTLMLDRVTGGLNPGDATYMSLIVVLKFASLVIYGYLIHKLYQNAKLHKDLSTVNKRWQRNIFFIHAAYIATYGLYGVLISNHIASGFFYHLPIATMSLMVLFLGFSASVQPSVFSGLYSFENHLFFKYEKSGLTKSLSQELRENLKHLFDDEKIYKQNDISLESLAEKLNTTRHNASQVINEQFGMNFHELVNRYRIEEAKYILEQDIKKSLNIIDVAYEVGFNNKVTFNKAFKKDTQLTPSQFQRSRLQLM